MESSENRLEHSSNVFPVGQATEAVELDDNSALKTSVIGKHEEKLHLTHEGKAAAIELLKRIEILEHKIDELESKDVEITPRKKKIRRKAKEIPRTYKCMFSNCGKEYGSEASLKNHRKIKHGIRLIRKSKNLHKTVTTSVF